MTTRFCPTCGHKLPRALPEDFNIDDHVKFAKFKQHNYESRVLDTLKLQLDVMSEADRDFILDVMLRIMAEGITLEQPTINFPRVIRLYDKYCS